MTRIAILTDSTANLPELWANHYRIQVVPLKIHWESRTYLDGIGITPDQLYREYRLCNYPPTTSQPSMYDFLHRFENLAEHAEGILAPLISSGISGTVGVAQAAVHEFTRVPVEIIDTRVTAMGQMLIVLTAARAAEQGKSLQEIQKITDAVVQQMRVFFTVDTLKYLHRGGRINGTSRLLGTALDIKPILTFSSAGKIETLERVRTKKKSLQRMIALAKETAQGKPVHVAIAHACDQDTANLLCEEAQKNLNCIEMATVEFSPAIGVHLGPGAVGIALYSENSLVKKQP